MLGGKEVVDMYVSGKQKSKFSLLRFRFESVYGSGGSVSRRRSVPYYELAFKSCVALRLPVLLSLFLDLETDASGHIAIRSFRTSAGVLLPRERWFFLPLKLSSRSSWYQP